MRLIDLGQDIKIELVNVGLGLEEKMVVILLLHMRSSLILLGLPLVSQGVRDTVQCAHRVGNGLEG